MTGSQFTSPNFPAHQGPSYLGRTSGEENRPINAPTELEADENRLRFDRSRIPVFNSEAPPNRLPPGQSPAARLDDQADAIHATAPVFIDRNLFPRSSDYPSDQVPSESSSFIHPAHPSYEQTIPSAQIPNFEGRNDLGSNLADIRNLPSQFEFKNPPGNPQTLPHENSFESYPGRSVTNEPSNNVAASPYTHLDRSIPIKARENQYYVADSHIIDDDSEASFDAEHGASKAHFEADRHQSEESHNLSVEDGHDELVPRAATPSITASSGGPKDKRLNEVGPQFRQEPCEDLHAGRSPHQGYLSTPTGELDRIHRQQDPLHEAEFTSSMDFSHGRAEENRFDPARPQFHVQQDEHFQAGRSSTMKDNTAPRGEPEKGQRQQDQPHAGDFQVEKTTAHEIDQAPPIKKSIATFHSPTKEHNLNESSKDIFSAHLTADLDPRPEFSFSPQVTHSKLNSPQSSEASLPLHSSSRGSQHENQPLSNSHQQVLPTDQAAQDRLSDNVFAGDAKISETILPNRQESSQSRSDFYHFPPYSSGLDSEASQGISNRDREEDLSQECRSGDSATDDQDHHHRQISGPSPATEKTRRKFYFNPELAASRNLDANETTVAMNIVPPNEEILDTEETQAALPGFELVSTLSEHTPVAGQVMGAHTDDETYSTQAHDRTEHISDSSSSADIPIESTVSATNQGHTRSISMTQQSSSSDNQNSIIIYSDHPPTQETHDTISESPSGNSPLLEEMQGSSLDDQEIHGVIDKVFDFSSTVDQRHDESSDASQSPPEQSELPIREPLRREPPADPSVLVTAEKENPEVGFFRGSTSTLSTRPYRSSSHESESEVSGEAVETLGEYLRPRHSILEPESEAAQEEASSDGEVDSHHEDNSHNRDRYELENVMDEEEFLPPGQEPTPYDMEGSEASFSDEDLDYSYTGDVPTTHLSTITELSESLAEAHLSRSPLSQNWPSQSSPAVQHESHIDEKPLGYTETHPVQLERTASLAGSSLAEDVSEDIPPRLEDSSQSHEITVESNDNQSRSLHRTSNHDLASLSHNSPRDIPVPQDDGSMVEHEMFRQEDSLSDVGHEHGPNISTELDQSSQLKEPELIPAAHNNESFVPPLPVANVIPANEVQINRSTVSDNQSTAQSDFHTEAMLTVDNLVEEVLSMIPEQNNKPIVLDSPVPAETHSFDNHSIEQEESGRTTPDSVLHASIREVTSDKVADSQETEAERIAHSDSAEPPSHPLKDDSLQLSVSDASAGTLDENTREVVSDPLSGNHETPVQHHPEAVEPPSQPPHEDSSQLVVGDEKHDEVEILRNEVRDSSDAADGPAITPVSPQEPLPDHNELPTLLSAALPTPEPAEFIEATASSEAQDVPTPAHSELPHEASIPVDILEEEVSSPTTKPLTEAVVIDQLLPVLTERPRNHTTGHAEEDAIERATPSNQSILDIVDQVSGHTEIEERPSHPSPTDEDSAGLSQVAPQNIPIPEDSTRLEEHEDIGLDDSFKDNTGHENAMITSPTTLAPTITAPPGDGIEAMQTSEAQAIDSQNDAVHPADGLVEEATSLSEKAAEQIINHEVAEALSQSPKDNSPHLVVGNANEEKVEIHSSHLSDVKDAVGDPASPTEEIPSNDLLADDPNLKSQPAQALVATEPPSVETKNLEELTGKGTTESSEPTDESTSPSLATDRLLVETEGPERHTIEHAETEIHAVAAEQIPNSPAKVPSHPQTDDITQIISSDPKDEMVGTPSKRFQDPSGAEEVRSTTTAPPEQLQPAISQESTIQPTLAPAAQPTPGPVDATDGIKAPGAQVLHSTIAETDTGPAQSEINTEAELTVKSSAENAPSSSLSSELPQDNAVLDQQISAETGSLEHHPTKPPMPFDATESIAPPVNVKDTIPSSEVEVQANDKVSGNTAIETNPLQPILSNGDLAGFSPVPPQDVPIPESKASVAPQDIPIPESKASMTEPETGKQDDSLRLDLGHADTAPPSPLDKSSPEGHESISALGSSESVVAPVDATETTSASVAQTIQPSGDRQLQIEIESLDNHDMEQALQLPRSPEELESKPTTDLEVSREGVPHDGTQDSESTSIDAEAAPQEAEPAPQEAEPVPQESKPAPQETELSPQESESAPLEAESAPQESGSAPQESKPVPEESESAPQEPEPAPQDSQPAPQEPESAPQDPQPALQEAQTAPQQSESAPREAEPVPQESEPAPQEPESAPQEPKSTPQDSQPAPQEAETAPQPSESAPREAEPFPQESEPAPQEPEPAPQDSQPAPQEAETAPQESEPAPQEAETAPQESKSAPQEPESAPQEAKSAPQDSQPALQEFETAPQESEPAPQESKSAPQEADPVPQESEPAPQEPESTPHGSQPAPQEAETAPQEPEPAPQETESASQQFESAPQEAEPVPQESEPAPQEPEPAPQEPETAPQESEPAPQEAETAPQESESAPQEPESAPQEAESAPQDPQSALQESETAPQESEPAPQESESAPQEADPVPQDSEPAPQEPESTPHDSQPAPQEAETAPHQPAPQESETAPQEPQSAPPDTQPAPQEAESAPQDSQPAPQEAEAAPQESEPAPQEAEPVPQESESAPQEPESAPQEAKSAPQDPQPALQEFEPAPQESEPAPQESESAPQEAEPVPQESESAPQEPESAPQEPETAPQESEPAPQEAETAPQESESAPQEPESAPQEAESAPQDPQPALQESETAPQESEPAPQQSESAPREAEPVPQESEPAPQEPESAPQEPKSTPQDSQPAPQEAETAPQPSESAPREAEPFPQESEPAPQEPEPALQESETAPQESEPAPQESESAPQEADPVPQESEPAPQEPESTPHDSQPAPQEAETAPQESEPAPQETESAPQEAESAPQESETAHQEPQSAPQDTQPAPQEAESAPQDSQPAPQEAESAPQESESAPQEPESAPQEAESAPQDPQPAPQESEPAPQESESAPQEAEPVPQESELAPQEPESTPQDSQPAPQEAEAAPQESEPAPQESEPAPQETKSAPQEAEPVPQESELAPQEPKSTPQDSQPAPQEAEAAPQESEPAPQEPESAPQEAEPAPQELDPAPQDTQPAPQEAESAPQDSQPAPQDSQPAPQEAETAPQESESAPQESEPASQEPETAPREAESAPQESGPAPQESKPVPEEPESASQEAESAPQEAEPAPQESKPAHHEPESASQEPESAPQDPQPAPQDPQPALEEPESTPQESEPAPQEAESAPQEAEQESESAPQEAEPSPQEPKSAPQEAEPAPQESKPAPQEAESAPQESESGPQETESAPQELDPTPQEPLVNAAVGMKPALTPKTLSELHLATFLSTPPVSSTSVPQPPINLSANGKAWPAAPAVSNVHREVILPARMKKISTISNSSARTLFMKDLATFAFPFSPPQPLTRKPVINSEAPTTSPTGPTSPPPRAPQPHHQNTSSSPSTRAKSISSRHKLIKPYPSLKRTRATESPDHRSRRSSYRSFTFLNTIAPQATDGARGVHRTRSIKMSEFGLGHKSHKRRSARPEQNNDLGDAFAIIEMSDAMPYTPRSDRYVNPTISRRLSTSVKDILHKRNNRHNLLGKSPLDDVYLAEDFHFDMERELANLPESLSEEEFQTVEIATAGPSVPRDNQSRLEDHNVRRSVETNQSTKPSASDDRKGKKHRRVRSKLAEATISIADKIIRN
ncbi:hypothetical protein PGT21_020878 [Puccinia graminis f. sp. tritici]|uniref:Uncharacterized protein n=1 Tax=Puccinia graminis f. sp. tritici TaxID=56615 RepID=A0A5B0N6U7_PUCGR|nr:hypothetical protein PGT21_020878 [Puccinia graminis f. sp. tritici]